MGLYLQNSIALFLFIITLYYLLKRKNLLNKFNNKINNNFAITSFIVILLFGYIYMSIVNTKHTNIQKEVELLEKRENVIVYGEMSSNIKQGQYKNSFYIDVFKIELDNKEINLKKNNIKLIVYIDNSNKYNIMQGDYIKVAGNFSTISSYNNFEMFNYKEYMSRKNIYGNVYSSNIELVKKKNNKIIYTRFKIINYIKSKIKNNINTENNGLLTGILIGDKEDIPDEKIEEFKNSNLSHILAVSGTHVSILITLLTIVLDKVIKSYKIKNIIIIGVLIFFLFIIGNTPSVLRAVIMTCLVIVSKLLYRKSNNINNLFISAFIILLLNPYYLLDLGFELSFLATLGIILFVREFEKIIPYIIIKTRKSENKKIFYKISKYIISTLIVSISANLLIIPIVLYNTNNISFNFIISNIIISPLIFILEMLGIIFLIVPNISILNYLIEIVLYLISSTAKYCSKIEIFSFLLTTPNIIQICIYYILIYFVYIVLKDRNLRVKIKLYTEKIAISITKNKYKIICILIASSIIIFIISKIYILNSKLEIHFLDVSQGDSTLIITKTRKSILIDGGGNENYDIGKNILKPYLLKRKINVLDYIIISHMDFDHCGGILTLMEEIKVKNVIIGKQFQESKNYEKFINIVQNKKVKVFIVEAGQRINIENDLYFDILWPDSKNIINENILNNNSLVCKLSYKNFSILFTGDIEEVAEKEIIQKYGSKSNILNSLVLKVAHHGSKTSTIKDFLMKVNPKIALIGVGKNNKFGHPSDITLESLYLINTQIYRTDKDGEILIKTDGNEIEIDKFIN